MNRCWFIDEWTPLGSLTKEVNPWLGKRPLKTNGRLANRGLTSSVKEATGITFSEHSVLQGPTEIVSLCRSIASFIILSKNFV